MRLQRLLLYLMFLWPAQSFAQNALVTQFGMTEGLNSTGVSAILEDTHGVLWVASFESGLFRMLQGRLERQVDINSVTGLRIIALGEQPDGALVISTPNGIFEFDGFTVRKAEKVAMKVKTAPDWVFNTGQQINCTLPGDLGEYWVGTDDGLYATNSIDSFLYPIRDAQGLLDGQIECLAFDRNDNLWIGTRTDGLLLYQSALEYEQAHLVDGAQGIVVNPEDGSMLIVSKKGEVFCEDATARNNFVTCLDSALFIDRIEAFEYGNMWAFSEEGRLGIVDKERFVWIPENATTQTQKWAALGSSAGAEVIAEDNNGGVFSIEMTESSDEGQVFRLRKLTDTGIRDKVVDWFSAGPRQWYRVGEHSVISNRRSDVHFASMVDSKTAISAAALSRRGGLWLGHINGSLVWMREDGKTVSIELPQLYDPSPIVFLHNTTDRVLWLGTKRNVWQCLLDESGSIIKEVQSRHFASSGHLSNKSFALADNGTLYVLDDEVIAEIQIRGYETGSSRPIVMLTDVVLADGAIKNSRYGKEIGPFLAQHNPLKLSYSDNQIAFSYIGVESLDNTTTLTYSWRLSDKYSEWSEKSTRKSVQFAGLAPGEYRFDVRVCNNRNECSTLNESWVFMIKKPFWYLWWFWLVCAILVIAGIVLLVKKREQSLLGKANAKQALTDARLRAVELEQKALQLQMNPHFIFNALQSVNQTIDSSNKESAKTALTKFSKLMRAMLEMSRSSTVSLEDEIDFLSAYVDVQNIGRNKPLKLDIDIAGNITPFDIEIPPLLIQPLIENSIKYGAESLGLQIFQENETLNLVLRDDGPGFPEEIISANGHGNADSVALTLIRERLSGVHKNAKLTLSNLKKTTDLISGAEAWISIPEVDV